MPFEEPIPSWQERLNRAHTRQDVVRVARDYLVRMTPVDLHRLPESCRPGKIVDGDDVSHYALTLVQCSCAPANLGDPDLQRLGAFFTRAAVRLAQITSVAREIATEDRGRAYRS
jgi:hypothetical protein